MARSRKREAFRMVREILGEDKAALWWTAPNPNFGGITGMQMLELSRRTRDRLYGFIQDAYESEQIAQAMRAAVTTGDA